MDLTLVRRVAFFYGDVDESPSDAQETVFKRSDLVVVEAENISSVSETHELLPEHGLLIARVRLSEMAERAAEAAPRGNPRGEHFEVMPLRRSSVNGLGGNGAWVTTLYTVLRAIKAHLEAGYDGVMLDGLDAYLAGAHHPENVLHLYLREIARHTEVWARHLEKSGICVLAQGGAKIHSRETLALLNGVVLNNVTLTEDCEPKMFFGEDYDKVKACLQAGVFQLQERSDFLFLVHECIASPAVMRGDLLARSLRFCQDNSVFHGFCTDPSHADPRQVCHELDASLSGPLRLQDEKQVAAFVSGVKDSKLAVTEGEFEADHFKPAIPADRPVAGDLASVREVLRRDFATRQDGWQLRDGEEAWRSVAAHAGYMQWAADFFKELATDGDWDEADPDDGYENTVARLLDMMAAYELEVDGNVGDLDRTVELASSMASLVRTGASHSGEGGAGKQVDGHDHDHSDTASTSGTHSVNREEATPNTRGSRGSGSNSSGLVDNTTSDEDGEGEETSSLADTTRRSTKTSKKTRTTGKSATRNSSFKDTTGKTIGTTIDSSRKETTMHSAKSTAKSTFKTTTKSARSTRQSNKSTTLKSTAKTSGEDSNEDTSKLSGSSGGSKGRATGKTSRSTDEEEDDGEGVYSKSVTRTASIASVASKKRKSKHDLSRIAEDEEEMRDLKELLNDSSSESTSTNDGKRKDKGNPDDYLDDPSFSAPHISGQKAFGRMDRIESLRRVIAVQTQLRDEGTLKNLSLEAKGEVFCGDPAKNNEAMIYSEKFDAAIKLLEGFVNAESFTPSAERILDAFSISALRRSANKDERKLDFHDDSDGENMIITVLRMMLAELRERHPQQHVPGSTDQPMFLVQVWESDPLGLVFPGFHETTRFASVAQYDEPTGILHIYIDRSHPNYAEALINAYFGAKLGYPNMACVLLEGLARTPADDDGDSDDEEYVAPVISDRARRQLTTSAYSELVAHVLNTPKVVAQITRAMLPAPQRALAISLAHDIRDRAKTLLLTDVREAQENKAEAMMLLARYELDESEPVAPLTAIFVEFRKLLNLAGWQPVARQHLLAICGTLAVGQDVMETHSVVSQAISRFLVAECRGAGMDEIEQLVRDSNRYLVREPDICTIYLECGGYTEADTRRLFGLSRFDLGAHLYKRVREAEVKEAPEAESLLNTYKPYERSLNRLLSFNLYVRKYFDGLFFMFPLLINTLLVILTGVGMFTSKYVDAIPGQAVSYALLLSFIVTSPLSNVIARLGSYYLFQYSHVLVTEAVTRSMVGGLIVVFITGVIAVAIVTPTLGGYAALVFIAFYFGFTTMLLLISGLYNTHVKSIWSSLQGIVILVAMAVDLGIVIAGVQVFNFRDTRVVWVQVVGLLVANVILGVMLMISLHLKTVAYQKVAPTPVADVLKWYAQNGNGPAAPPAPGADIAAYETALIAWFMREIKKADADAEVPSTAAQQAKRALVNVTRKAWEAFAAATNAQLHRKCCGVKPRNAIAALPYVRAKKYPIEEELVHWHVLITEKQVPEAFTAEWDQLLGEAKAEWPTKARTDTLHRSGLLWNYSRVYMAHGCMYFMVLFLDRILRLLLSSNVAWFFGSPYEEGMAWALIYLLTAFGCLEPVPCRLQAHDRMSPHARLFERGASPTSMLREERFERRAYYLRELTLLVVGLVVCAVPATVCHIVFTPHSDTPIDVSVIFGVAMAGYAMFVVASFNTFFLAGRYSVAAWALAMSFVVGMATGFVLVITTHQPDLVVIGLAMACMTYMVITTREVLRDMSTDVNSAPKVNSWALQNLTSGQRWAGPGDGAWNSARIDRLAKTVESTQQSMGVPPDSALGREVLAKLTESVERLKKLRASHPLVRAFPKYAELLPAVYSRWLDGHSSVSLMPEATLSEGFRCPYAAISKHSDGMKTLCIYVAVAQANLAQHVAEALLHETLEREWGYSHADATVAELLLSPITSAAAPCSVPVPARLQRQVLLSASAELDNLVLGTNNAICEAGMLKLDVNGQWRSTAPAARAVVVAVAEMAAYDVRRHVADDDVVSCECCEPNPDPSLRQLRALSGLSKSEFEATCQQLSGGPGRSFEEKWMRGLLSARLASALRIESQKTLRARTERYAAHSRQLNGEDAMKLGDINTMHRFGSEPLDDLRQHLAAKPLSLGSGREFLQRVDTFLRLLFCSLTGDPCFSRELDYARHAKPIDGGLSTIGKIFAPGLVLLARLARTLINVTLWSQYWILRPHFRRLNRYLRHGLNRTVYYNANGISHVHRHLPEAPCTAFVSVQQAAPPPEAASSSGSSSSSSSTSENGDEQAAPRTTIVADVVPQCVTNNPGPAARTRSCEYRMHDRERRIHRSVALKAGKVLKTNFYYYDSDDEDDRLPFIPSERHVYAGEVAAENELTEELMARGEAAHREAGEQNRNELASARQWAHFEADPRLERIIEYDNKGREAAVIIRRTKWKNGIGVEDARGYILIRGVYTPNLDVPSCDATSDSVCFSDVRVIPGRQFRATFTVKFIPRSTRLEWMERSIQLASHSDDSDEGVQSRVRAYFMYRHVQHPFLRVIDVNTGTPHARFEDPWDLQNAVAAGGNIYDEDLLLVPRRTTTVEPMRCCGFLRKKERHQRFYTGPYSTKHARVLVWREWKEARLAGMHARLWDEYLLRQHKTLKPYWSARDAVRLQEATEYLSNHEGVINPSVHVTESDLQSQLLIRMPDLLLMGRGGDAHDNARHQGRDFANMAAALNSRLPDFSVLALDSGTWPSDGGGVAVCRAAVVDKTTNIRWISVAEVGTPAKMIVAQAERNVDAFTLVPLWGTDMGGPNEGILAHLPYGQLAARCWRTTDAVIREVFVPLLQRLADACAVQNPDEDDLQGMVSLLANLHNYFQEFDWQMTWSSGVARGAWRDIQLRLAQKRHDSTVLYAAENPSLADIDCEFELLSHFLMPLAVPIPREVPVVHASHHGAQAMVGVVARAVTGASFVIWDHGMLYRERCRAIAEVKIFPMAVRNGLVGLTRLSVFSNYFSVDGAVSCTNIGNPDWQARLGGRDDSLQVAEMRRRMSPVVNGMETDTIGVNRAIEEARPTAIMLSHVYDLKDIKNAIQATAVIVHRFGQKNFHLLVYGSTTKDPAYVSDCRNLIAVLEVANNVTLAGLGAAAKVLPRGWVFVNSSQSEGLPLALGEAGLAGLPVICTDVGGSREVVADAKHVYGRVVPPRNPLALARGILEVLAMVGELEALGSAPGEAPPTTIRSIDDYAPLSATGPPLEERIMAMKVQRQRLGMRYRAFVMAYFSMERYIREHKQSVYIGRMRRDERLAQAYLVQQGKAVTPARFDPFRHLDKIDLAAALDTKTNRNEASSSAALCDLFAYKDTTFNPSAVSERYSNMVGVLHREKSSLETQLMALRESQKRMASGVGVFYSKPGLRSGAALKEKDPKKMLLGGAGPSSAARAIASPDTDSPASRRTKWLAELDENIGMNLPASPTTPYMSSKEHLEPHAGDSHVCLCEDGCHHLDFDDEDALPGYDEDNLIYYIADPALAGDEPGVISWMARMVQSVAGDDVEWPTG